MCTQHSRFSFFSVNTTLILYKKLTYKKFSIGISRKEQYILLFYSFFDNIKFKKLSQLSYFLVSYKRNMLLLGRNKYLKCIPLANTMCFIKYDPDTATRKSTTSFNFSPSLQRKDGFQRCILYAVNTISDVFQSCLAIYIINFIMH